MTVRRLDTARGAILYDRDLVTAPDDSLFEVEVWRERNLLSGETSGRGSVFFLRHGDDEWVLRHYRRGGHVGRWVRDSYVYTGESRVRAFREWRLLHILAERHLPVPRPVAARYLRRGPLYTADLVTSRIPAAAPLSHWLARGPLDAAQWRQIGAMIRRFHDAGVWHADLTAHNILLDSSGQSFLLDFDRGRIRGAGAWREANLARLLRSLRKIRAEVAEREFPDPQWPWLLAGYSTPS